MTTGGWSGETSPGRSLMMEIRPRKTYSQASFQRSTIYFVVIHFVFNDEHTKYAIKTNCTIVTFRYVCVTNRCHSNARPHGLTPRGTTDTVKPHYYRQSEDRVKVGIITTGPYYRFSRARSSRGPGPGVVAGSRTMHILNNNGCDFKVRTHHKLMYGL